MARQAAAAGSPAAEGFDELERAVRHLGEELAFFRRRALDAERRVRELSAQTPTAVPSATPSGPAAVDPAVQARVDALETENHDLRERLREAAERTRVLADRVRFVRQQTAPDDSGATG